MHLMNLMSEYIPFFSFLRSAMEVFEAAHHRGRWKRQSGVGDGPKSVPAPQSSTGQKIRDEFNKDVNFVAQKAGVQTYHVIIFIVIVLIAVVGVLAWCVVRFFRKKRRGKDDKADLAADEAALVENEEEDMKVISATNFDNYVLSSTMTQGIVVFQLNWSCGS